MTLIRLARSDLEAAHGLHTFILPPFSHIQRPLRVEDPRYPQAIRVIPKKVHDPPASDLKRRVKKEADVPSLIVVDYSKTLRLIC